MAWASTLSRQAARFGVSALPWYAWGAIAAGVAVLIGTRKAAAAPPAPGATLAPKPPGPAPMLKKGSSGPWVSYLQSLLGIQQTAVFDAATDTSVKAFQKSKGLGVDGVVGKDTWGALGVATAPSGGTAPKQPGTTYGDPTKPSGGGGGSGAGSPAPPPAGDSFSLPPPLPGGGGVLAEDIGGREAQILAAINAGDVDHQWADVTWTKDGHTVKVKVSRRPLALTGTWSAAKPASKGGGSVSTPRLIPSVSFKTAQKIADAFGAYLLTTKVSDEAYKQASLKIPPTNTNWAADGTMAKSFRMVEQSNNIAAKIGAHGGLTANEGKDWIITRRNWTPAQGGTGEEKPESTVGSRHNGANFGWYPGGSKSPGGASVIQSVGLAHDRSHADYSQLVRLMLPTVEINGVPHEVSAVVADPAKSSLLQDEGGTLPGMRHPDM